MVSGQKGVVSGPSQPKVERDTQKATPPQPTSMQPRTTFAATPSTARRRTKGVVSGCRTHGRGGYAKGRRGLERRICTAIRTARRRNPADRPLQKKAVVSGPQSGHAEGRRGPQR